MNARRVASAVCLVIGISSASYAAPPAQVGTVRPSDQTLTTRVQQTLSSDPRLREAEIDVRTVGGVVLLDGKVASYLERDRAEQLCEHINGVQRVQCQLEVDIFASADERLAQAVQHRLEHDALLRSERLDVTVQAGVVTLRGHIDTDELANHAQIIAHEVPGVVMLRKELQVGSAPAARLRTDNAIRGDVLVRYKQDPHLSRWPLFVEVHRGVVVLRGAVGNVLQREGAHKAAAAVEGVRDVDNRVVLMRPAAAASPPPKNMPSKQ
jgi:osmotically-inducible protein OsmY